MAKKESLIDKQVSSFIDEVGLYSKEHIQYLDKLNKLLDDMKNSKNSTDRKNYPSFSETVRAFNLFLQEKNIKLTPHEQDRLTVISSSGLSNMAKKRMVEDLIHSVKERHSLEIENRVEEERRKKEIGELQKSRIVFVNWYRLFKFALFYGTITLFSHRLKYETFERFRSNLFSWFFAIEPDLKKALDLYYYYLSVSEYNSIKKLYLLQRPIKEMMNIKKMLSYSDVELHDVMSDFASCYIKVMVNIKYIDSGLKKVFKDKNPSHGFWGFIGLITDRPMVNGKVVRYTEENMMKESVKGALFSYYSVCSGVPVATFNQLMYIVGEDGLIDSAEKELTDEAKKDMESKENIEHSEAARINRRLDELENLTTKYKDYGVKLCTRIFSLEAKGNINVWNKEMETRPFFKVVKLMDGLKKYLLEIINDKDNIALHYDDKDYNAYFDAKHDLLKAIKDFLDFSNELQGSREKELLTFKFPSSKDDKDELPALIERFMNSTSDSSKVSTDKNIRESLKTISSICYNLSLRFNDIINYYNNSKKVQNPDLTQNYDFFINAKLIHQKVRNIELLLNKREPTLSDIVEAGCSISFSIAEYLCHPGVRAIYQEVENLKKESLKFLNDATNAEDDSKNKNTEDKVDAIYYDSLTGIKNWAYFEDFILQEDYDEDFKYKHEANRYVFCIEIANLQDINRVSGRDAGDRVFKRLIEVIAETIRKKGKRNFALRGRGGIIIGYLMDCQRIDAIDALYSIYTKMNSDVLSGEIDVTPEPVIISGIYTERKGSSAFENIEIAKKIMIHGFDGVKGHIAYLKKEEQIIAEKDLDRKGHLKEGIVSILR